MFNTKGESKNFYPFFQKGTNYMRALYDSKSSLDDRGIKNIMSEKSKYDYWLKVERALAKAQAEIGLIPESAAFEIEQKAILENFNYALMQQNKNSWTWFCLIFKGNFTSIE